MNAPPSIFLTFEGILICLIPEQSKHDFGIRLIPSGKVNFSNLIVLPNAYSPNSVTVLGIFNFSSSLQYPKADFPIFVIPSGKITSFKFLHS